MKSLTRWTMPVVLTFLTTANAQVITNPSFEAMGGSLAGWTPFMGPGKTAGGVILDPTPGAISPRAWDGDHAAGCSVIGPGYTVGAGIYQEVLGMEPGYSVDVLFTGAVRAMDAEGIPDEGDDLLSLLWIDGIGESFENGLPGNAWMLDQWVSPFNWEELRGEITPSSSAITLIVYWDFGGGNPEIVNTCLIDAIAILMQGGPEHCWTFHTLTGTVREIETDEPIPGALVEGIIQSLAGQSTDSDLANSEGSYTLELTSELDSDRFEISASAPGYRGTTVERYWLGCPPDLSFSGDLYLALLTPTPTPSATPFDDADGDGVADTVEAVVPLGGESNMYLTDSDGDGIPDGMEDANRNGFHLEPGETSPRDRFSDSDEYEDGIEALILSSDPRNPGSPGTVFIDDDEDQLPDDIDPDPESIDTDGDRFMDSYEAVMLNLAAVDDSGISPTLGDVNQSETWDNADAQLLLNFFARKPVVPTFTPNEADANRDAFIDNADAQHVLNYFAFLLAVLPHR